MATPTETISRSATDEQKTDLFTVAHDLLLRANEERLKGNGDAAAKLLRAASGIMGENVSADGNGQPNGTQQVAELLKKGWQEVSHITEATGMSANRVHVILGRLKGRGKGLESQHVKRYRLVDSK